MKLTEKKRLEIIENIETNKSNRFIARKVGVSPSTVANIINKYRILVRIFSGKAKREAGWSKKSGSSFRCVGASAPV